MRLEGKEVDLPKPLLVTEKRLESENKDKVIPFFSIQ